MKTSKILHSILYSFLLSPLLLLGQQIQIQTLTLPSLPATFCKSTPFTVDVLETCVGISFTNDSVHVSGNNISVYLYYSLNSSCSNTHVPTKRFFNLGKLQRGTYNITARGFVNGSLASYGSMPVIVGGPDANFTPSDTIICAGDSVFYINTSTGGAWQDWYENGTLVSKRYNYGKVYTIPGTYVIQNEVWGLSCKDIMTHTIYVSDSMDVLYLGNDTALCEGSSLILDAGTNRDSVVWNDLSSNNTLTVTATGSYYVTVYKNDCQLSDTIHVKVNVPQSNYLPEDTTTCDSLVFDLSNAPLSTFNWSNGATSAINKILSTGKVWFTAIDTLTGCSISDTSDVFLNISANIPSYSKDTAVCGNVFNYDISLNRAASYMWYDGNTNPKRSFLADGSYWFEIYHWGGCRTLDTLNVHFTNRQANLLPNEVILCDNDSAYAQLNSSSYSNILWSNGFSSQSTFYFNLGQEWVMATDISGCVYIDTFEIINPTPRTENYFTDTSVCIGETLILQAPEGTTFITENGKQKTLPITNGGGIRVELSDGCTNHIEYVNVSEYNCKCPMVFPDAFTPDHDGLNDLFGPVTSCEFTAFDLEIYNRYGQRIFHSKDPELLFDGTWRGENLPLGVYVYFFEYSTPYTKGKERGHLTLIR